MQNSLVLLSIDVGETAIFKKSRGNRGAPVARFLVILRLQQTQNLIETKHTVVFRPGEE